MADFAPTTQVAPSFIHTFSLNAGTRSRWVGLSPTSITWVANHGIYVPVTIPMVYPVRRVFWVNGSTVSSGTSCFAIYSADGTQLYTTTALTISGASAPQYTDVTDFTLGPGTYWFGFSCSQTTNRVTGVTTLTVINQRMMGVLQQGSVATLPSTMGSAVAASQALYPLCGITRTTSGF